MKRPSARPPVRRRSIRVPFVEAGAPLYWTVCVCCGYEEPAVRCDGRTEPQPMWSEVGPDCCPVASRFVCHSPLCREASLLRFFEGGEHRPSFVSVRMFGPVPQGTPARFRVVPSGGRYEMRDIEFGVAPAESGTENA